MSDCDQFALKFLEAISVSKALVVPTLAGIPQQKQEPSEEEGANDAVKAKGVVVVGGKKESDADGDDGEGDDDDDDGVAFRVVFVSLQHAQLPAHVSTGQNMLGDDAVRYITSSAVKPSSSFCQRPHQKLKSFALVMLPSVEPLFTPLKSNNNSACLLLGN